MKSCQQTSYELLQNEARRKELLSAQHEEKAQVAETLPSRYQHYEQAIELILSAASIRMKAVLDLRMRDIDDLEKISLIHEIKRIAKLNYGKVYELYESLEQAIKETQKKETS